MGTDTILLFKNPLCDILKTINNEDAGMLIKAIFIDQPIEKESIKIAYYALKDQIDRSGNAYNNICERNSNNIKKRWKNHTPNIRRNTSNKPGNTSLYLPDPNPDPNPNPENTNTPPISPKGENLVIGEVEKELSPTETEFEFKKTIMAPGPFKKTFEEFQKHRKAIKKPMTPRAIELLVCKLDRMAKDDDTRIAILNQSIMNGWTDVFALKTPIEPKRKML